MNLAEQKTYDKSPLRINSTQHARYRYTEAAKLLKLSGKLSSAKCYDLNFQCHKLCGQNLNGENYSKKIY